MSKTLDGVISDVSDSLVNIIIQPLIYLLIGLSFFYFFWGLALFVLNGDEQQKREEGRNHMIYGGLGLLIISGVWGILSLLNSTVGTIFS